MILPGVYRAKAVKLDGKALTTYVPQIFGDTSISILDIAGDPPATFPAMGWVTFQSGLSEAPVWLGVPVGADVRYVNVTGDAMTGMLTINAGAGPNIRSNITGAANVDGVVHVDIRSDGTQIGRITRATSSTAGFLTSSDEELKENIVLVDDDLALLWMRSIEPYFFNYIDKPDVRHVGYSAQRVAAAWPNGISNGIVAPGHGDISARTWDANGQETTPTEVWEAWMMDHSKITPILHAALQTMDRIQTARTALLAEHEARLDALEAAVATQASQITALQQLAATHTAQIAANSQAILANTQRVNQLRTDVFYTRRFVAYWQFSNTTTAPPGAGQVRTSADNKTLWLHKVDTEGYDRADQFTMIVAGVEFAIRSTAGRTFTVRSTGLTVDVGTYITVPITVLSGVPDKGVRVEITIRTGIWASDTPPTPTLLPA